MDSKGAHEAPAHGLDGLRTQVREGFARGVLPTAMGELWAGAGTGTACIACGSVVKASDVEYEVIQNGTRFPMHLPCFRLWKEELDIRNEA